MQAVATTPVVLEPLSTGDIIDRSILIYRRNLRQLLAIVAVPFLIGSAAWLMMRFGLESFSIEGQSSIPPAVAGLLIVVGSGLYLIYGFLMVLAVAVLSRAVGDHIMLGRPITVKGSVAFLQGRFGDLALASLLLALAGFVIFAATMMILFVAFFVLGLVAVAGAAAGLPSWLTGIIAAVVLLLAFGIVVFLVLPFLLSRVVFVPQALMIEGCSAMNALTRSLTLGARNWRGVLGILLFSYFASLSLAAGVMIPITLGLWLFGVFDFDFDTFNAISGGINQFSSFLVVPVWAIAYTLLYFDSRVRNEGYDVDLLVRRLPQPAPQPIPVPGPATGPMPPRRPIDKFTPDGRCRRCGRVNMFNTASCAGCGW